MQSILPLFIEFDLYANLVSYIEFIKKICDNKNNNDFKGKEMFMKNIGFNLMYPFEILLDVRV